MSASAEHTFCANNLEVVNLIARLQITNSPTYPDNCRWAHDNHERGAFVVWDVLQKNKGMVRQRSLGTLIKRLKLLSRQSLILIECFQEDLVRPHGRVSFAGEYANKVCKYSFLYCPSNV